MFSRFERLLKPTDPPEQASPPPGFIAFFWHFARQAKGLFAALFAAGLVVALLDSTIPVFMGRIVTQITARPPDELFAQFWPHLLGMALVLLVARTCRTASGGRITGTWCASPGPSFRTTSPAASPTG
jgi:ATP-binding cassette subfamily B multidrug efflux pump